MLQLRQSIEANEPWKRYDKGRLANGDHMLDLELSEAFCYQTDKVDLAIIPLPNDVNWTEFGFGPFQELLFDVDPPSVPIGFQDDLRCTKLGISSGRTKAAIVERGAHIDLGGVSFRDVIIINSSNFLISGDSGALLVSTDENGNVFLTRTWSQYVNKNF